ncbi:CvpA family protein [Bacillus sp. FJAT-49736]|uniref:CvpA family protein n=1 Tax=Bacillus sp. FJAT-49736 TaxID=2833582 RepID=UPI001BC93555|nr:CvpA family protein [Bacillus sp. FJAT-49736]MBS4173762.1 CvpA family protein [Bacillus sp. FJAT-49736]
MVDIIILLIFVIGFFNGLRRGFILQLIHMASFIIAFIVAYMYYPDFADKLKLWIPYPSLHENASFKMIFDGMNVEAAYYRAIAFAIIFFAVKIILHIIGSTLDFVAKVPVIKQLNVWAGGILGFIEVYLFVFIVLYIGALIPIESIQHWIDKSFLAEGIIKNTPILSNQLKQWWLEYVG